MTKIDGPFIPPKSGKAKQLVIFLHGYGANGDDLLSIGTEWRDALPDAAFVSPNAPEPCDGSAFGYQWFPIRSVDRDAIEREKQAEKAAGVLQGFIDEQLAKWNVDESGLGVAGFSQGAMMAMYAMPRRKKPCAAVIGWSGMVIDAAGLKSPDIVKVPILAIHGDEDTIVDPQNLDVIEKEFSAAGFEVEAIMRKGLAHGIDQFGLMRGLDFIKERFEISEKISSGQVKATS